MLIFFQLNEFNFYDEPFANEAFHWVNDGNTANAIKGEDLNILPVWDSGMFGENVYLSVADGGVNIENEALKEHIDLNDTKIFNDDGKGRCPRRYDGDYSCGHGTATTGLAGGQIGKGILGAAPNSHISTQIETDPEMFASNNEFFDALVYKSEKIKIRSFSLGIAFYDNKTTKTITCADYRTNPYFTNLMAKASEEDNLVFVAAAGNSGETGASTNENLVQTDRHVVTVGGSTNRGAATTYSQLGGNIMINSPTNGMAIPLYEGTGENPLFGPFIPASMGAFPEESSYWVGFCGTSAVAPMVAGVIALVRQKNPDLTWFDIHEILYLTSTINDPTNSEWITNAAGYKFHPVLGFGRVNAKLAVDTAEKWISQKMPVSIKKTFDFQNEPIPNVGEHLKSIKFNFTEEAKGKVTEIIQFRVKTKNQNTIEGLRLYVSSPKGTRIEVLNPTGKTFASLKEFDGKNFDFDQENYFIFSTRGFFGEDASGIWTIEYGMGIYRPNICFTDSYLEIFTIDSIPTISDRKIGSDTHFVKKSNMPNVSCSIQDKTTLKAGETINFNLKFDVSDKMKEDNPSGVITIFDPISMSEFKISDWNFSNENGQFRVPTNFETKEFLLCFRLPFSDCQFMINATIENNHEEGFITSNFDFQHKKESDQSTFVIEYSKKETKILDTNYYQKVLVSIYNSETSEVIYTTTHNDRGIIYLQIPSHVKVNKGYISLLATSEQDKPLVHEISIKDEEAKPSETQKTKTAKGGISGTVLVVVIVISILIIILIISVIVVILRRRKSEYEKI